MKKRFTQAICFLAVSLSLVSCSKSEPNITAYYHDNNLHWAYTDTGEKYNEGVHILGEDHKCTVCDYVDPVYMVDENGVMIGLTDHGKSLTKLSVPSDVIFIDSDAFVDSSATQIYLPSSVLGISSKAYEYIQSISFESEVPSSEYIPSADAYFLRSIVSSENECMLNGVEYETLDKALDSIEKNNSRIILLEDEITLQKKHDVTFEIRIATLPLSNPYPVISGSLTLLASSVVEFGPNVEFDGDIFLEIREYELNYTTSAVAFQGLDKAPEKTSVKYLGSLVPQGETYYVQGAKQVTNKLIIFPVEYYAFGVLSFNTYFDIVTGLSPYGLMIKELTITSPVVGKSAIISEAGFSSKFNLKITFIKTFVDFTMWIVEGIFSHVIIGNGITEVGERAFYSYVDTDLSTTLNQLVRTIFGHIREVSFGDTVTKVKDSAFAWNYNLTTVDGSAASLTDLNRWVFGKCDQLKSANFSTASKLTSMDHNFDSCELLSRVVLPASNGWEIDGKRYLYEDLTPLKVAKMCIGNGCVLKKDPQCDTEMFAVYNPKAKDPDGTPYHIRYYKTFSEAISFMFDGEILKLIAPVSDFSSLAEPVHINKKITIDASRALDSRAVLKGNIFIHGNSYVIFTNKVDFQGNVILDNSESKALNNTAGVAFEYSDNIRTDSNATISYQHFDKKANAIKTAIGEKYYSSYGLYNFNIEDWGYETIFSISPLGLLMTELVINTTFVGSGTVNVNNGAFVGNKTVEYLVFSTGFGSMAAGAFRNCAFKKINFGIRLREIPQNAFENCVNLTEIDLSTDSDLETIEPYAFKGCNFKTAKVARVYTWTCNGLSMSAEIMRNHEKLAEMFTKTHTSAKWRNPNRDDA